MNDTDKTLFTYNYQSIDEEKMIGNIHLALKKYIMKEKMDSTSIEQCRKNYKRYFVDLLFFYSFLLLTIPFFKF